LRRLDLQTTNVFKRNYDTTSRIVVNQGGTRSSKTYSLAQLFIVLALQTTGKVFTICRKTLPALKATAYKDVFHILEELDLYNPEHHNKSDLTYHLNGNEFEFISVDQPQKIRGRKRNYLWCNESNEFNWEDFQQLILRTTERIFLDYNPSDPYSWIYDKVIPRDDSTFIKSTYLDNPFLPQETINEIERLKDLDDNYWTVYGLGEIGLAVETIFRNFQLINTVNEKATLVGIGMDFGFTNDPTAVVEVFKYDNNLYLNEIVYEKRLTNQDICQRLRDLNITRQTEIIGDSAEPKSIEEIYRQGFNIKPAKKGTDSVKMGIDIMRRYKIHITKNSDNTIKEFTHYKWSTDKNGQLLNKPIDSHNHSCDAVRYVCLNKLMTTHSGKYYVI